MEQSGRRRRRRRRKRRESEGEEEEEEEPTLKSSILNLYSNTCFDSENQIGPTSQSNIKRNGAEREIEEE